MPLPEIQEVQTKPNQKVNFPLSTRPNKENYEKTNPFKEAPIAFKTNYGGRGIYLSNIFEYSHYPVIFAYVEKNNKLEPRLLYFSKSHGIWRVAPVVDGKFGKGYEDFSCDLPPELNMALMQHYEKALNTPKWKPANRDFVAAFTYPIQNQFQEYERNYEEECTFQKEKIFIPDKKEGQLTFGYISKRANYDLTKSFPNPKDLPNLEDESNIEEIKIRNPFYSEHLIEGDLKVYSCASYNKHYRYLFAEGKNKKTGEQQRFLLTLAREPAQLSSFCVPSTFANLGYHTVTPLMRPANVKMIGIVNDVFLHDDKEAYTDISTYAGKQPINYLLNHPQEIVALQSGKSEALDVGEEIMEDTNSIAYDEEPSLNINIITSITKKLDEYVKGRADFLSNFTNNFRNEALTQLKVKIAMALKDSINEQKQLTANKAISYCAAAEALNLVIEELSDNNKNKFKNLASLENHDLVALFNGFIKNWDAIKKQADQEKAVTANTLGLNDSFQPNIDMIFEKIQKLANREEGEGLGKLYRSGFSSKLDRIITEIKSLVPVSKEKKYKNFS